MAQLSNRKRGRPKLTSTEEQRKSKKIREDISIQLRKSKKGRPKTTSNVEQRILKKVKEDTPIQCWARQHQDKIDILMYGSNSRGNSRGKTAYHTRICSSFIIQHNVIILQLLSWVSLLCTIFILYSYCQHFKSNLIRYHFVSECIKDVVRGFGNSHLLKPNLICPRLFGLQIKILLSIMEWDCQEQNYW